MAIRLICVEMSTSAVGDEPTAHRPTAQPRVTVNDSHAAAVLRYEVGNNSPDRARTVTPPAVVQKMKRAHQIGRVQPGP